MSTVLKDQAPGTRAKAPGNERPLHGAQRTALAISGIATIALCYLFLVLSIVAMLAILAVELLVLIAVARVGLAGKFMPVVRRHAPFLSIFLGSFWRRSGPDYRLLLDEKESPRLFAVLRQLAERFGIPPPREVSIEMNANAWVRLKGYRRGSGGTILAVGYDLLAGLTEGEAQAVLAHEMGHAKFIQRGVKRWLAAGVGSIGIVTSRLRAQAESFRTAGKTFHLAEMFLRPSVALTRMAARLLATYSRQDEFEADRISAEICGAQSLRSALIKLDLLEEKLHRVPWAERVAQLETESSFSEWLRSELHVSATTIPENSHAAAHDTYSTHPSLRDRLAALPPDDDREPDTAPAVNLLRNPDRVAADLIARVHRLVADEEQKDARSLAKWARKARRDKAMSPLQWLALPLIGVSVFLPLVPLADDELWRAALTFAIPMGAGILLWRRGRHRDRVPIPIPSYAVIKRAWQAERLTDFAEHEDRIEGELKAAGSRQHGKKRQIAFLLQEGVRALEQCEYLRAHVASRLAIGLNNKVVDAALIYVVAASGLSLWTQIDENLEFVRKRTGFTTPSTAWGAAWTLCLAGDWGRAESLLWQSVEKHPANPTMLALLALAQSQRDKLQSAAENAQRAAELEPALENIKLAARILIDAGRLREAEQALKTVESPAIVDTELSMLIVRLRLLRRRFDEAIEAANTLREGNGSPYWRIRLGEVFETARQDELAASFFNDSLTAGHYPEALLGLARLAVNRGEKDEARGFLASALNVEKAAGPGGRTSLELFHATIAQLNSLDDLRENCAAWIASFSATAQPAALANCSLLLYATSQSAAEKRLEAVLTAMQPSSPVTPTADLQWKPAPTDEQPARPVREGVQFVL